MSNEDSSSLKALSDALVKVQAAIRPAIKDSTNPAFRSKYADLNAVWEAIRQPLVDNGFSVIQAPDFEGETMWLETIILHTSGGQIRGRYPLRPVKQDPQGFGSALSYARRYSLSAMLGVVADIDDDGNAASAPQASKPATSALPSADDEDVTAGVRNWVDRQRALISECQTLPELTNWLDRNGGDLLKPALSSSLDKLMKKNNPAFLEVKNAYLQRMQKL